ncbi:MAG: hypothetical protein CM1200mP27_08180 [Chloroflexota bacterium]|nr:MAG: hypothetical protein CM1200mP27_08180 [Chloroflexota bacterium]
MFTGWYPASKLGLGCNLNHLREGSHFGALPHAGKPQETGLTSFSFDRATYSVGENALDLMLLEKFAFPEAFQGHQIIREGP